MKNAQLIAVLVVLGLGAYGLWYSWDFLSGIRMAVPHPEYPTAWPRFATVDGETTWGRFVGLWPVSMVAGAGAALLVGGLAVISLLFAEDETIKAKKAEMNGRIQAAESRVESAMSDREKAMEYARKADQRATEKAYATVAEERKKLAEDTAKVNRQRQHLKQKINAWQNQINKSNQEAQHWKRQAKLEKQKAKNHGNAVSRKNNFVERLKTDSNEINQFLAEHWNNEV